MNEHNLIKLGRFGNGVCENGAFTLRVYVEFQPSYLSVNDFFILFEDGRVRYLPIKLESLKGDRLTGKIDDRSVVMELLSSKPAWLALDEETIDSLNDFPGNPLGLSVIWEGREVGVVEDYFDNQSYHTLIVEKTDSEDSFMIPDVDEYVIEKNFDEKKIYVRNIADLIDL